MKKLNNKGMTTIEVILSFVLVTIVTMSMYETISTFNTKRLEEETKAKLYTYKNTLAKEIQDDLIKKGLLSANVISSTKVEIGLKSGETKILEIASDTLITYGDTNYPLPDVGEDEDTHQKDLVIAPATISVTGGVLSIEIPFKHPDLAENRYAIRIVCPINYNPTVSSDSSVVAQLQ